jgi:hypothetical protein
VHAGDAFTGQPPGSISAFCTFCPLLPENSVVDRGYAVDRGVQADIPK